MTEPTEYPIPLPVTPKMADRMRAAGWVPLSDDDAQLIAGVINREGAEPGNSIHGWRCSYPDRYGLCDCVDLVAKEIIAALRGELDD